MENITSSKKFFLWFHMHQPSYKIPNSSFLYLPWVRRHMLNGYYMIPKLLLDSEAYININFSGILLEQMKAYEEGKVKDIYQLYEEKEAAYLSEAEKNFIIEKFLVPLPIESERLNYLIEKKKKGDLFETQEVLDTQVIFMLSAFALPEKEIQDLRKKGKIFSESDKKFIQEEQEKIIRLVIPMYKMLADNNKIEITLSPYFHPVLPLLIDNNSAKESKNNAILPNNIFAFPEDAEAQINASIELFEKTFGIKPTGLWPSEGSVSNTTIDIIKNLGFEWIGTDELILRKNLESIDKQSGVYQVRNLRVFFRDHSLSDKIAFVYNKMNPQMAVQDLLDKQKENFDRLKIIILDGENPWMFYPDNGVPFLKELFKKLNATNSMLGKNCKANENIASIKPGSWINGYLDTWIGDKETNMAWSYLTEARTILGNNEKSMNDILTAEGSDSFWWYSNFHRNEVDYSFDYLFRLRLINAYKNANTSIPEYLSYPIKTND
jgi:alpha-amylase/alpha-mannosidase (GH57 family)